MIDEIHEMFVLPMNSYFMTHEPRADSGEIRKSRVEKP